MCLQIKILNYNKVWDKLKDKNTYFNKLPNKMCSIRVCGFFFLIFWLVTDFNMSKIPDWNICVYIYIP